jgi:hypothetical protein
MAVKRFSKNFNERTDVFDQITPHNKLQGDIRSPHGEWKPSAWLPVQFTKSNRDAGTDAFVISSGKLVAQDVEGRICPVGLRLQLSDGGAGLTYTQTDVDWGVYDLTTGDRVSAAVSYTPLQVAQALIARGLVSEQDFVDAGGTLPVDASAKATTVAELFISEAVGIIAYDIHVWSGRPEDGDQWFLNYSKQHLVQFLTEVQMVVPQRVEGSQAADGFDAATLDAAGSVTFASPGDTQVRAGEYWDATNLASITRYSILGITATSSVVAIGLDPRGDGSQARIAKDTDRTPIACDRAGVIVREKARPDQVVREGDWYIDYELGVLFLHTDTWSTLVGLGAVATNVSYSFYDDGAAATHQFVHFDGWDRPGAFLTYDEESNFRPFTASEKVAGIDPLKVVGRLEYVDAQPKQLLDQVKTAFTSSGMSATAQMPGSATKGFTDAITLSAETVADRLAVILVRI